MAKRYTDTEKWKKKWFRELGSKLRDVRQFILDDCDLAGFWEIDLGRVSYHIGESVSMEEVTKAFNQQITLLGDESMFIPSFIPFQYGNLVETNNAHRAVLKRLRDKELILNPDPAQTLPRPCPASKDKDKDQEKVKDQEKDQDKDSGLINFRKLRAQLEQGRRP